jgi:hypothetical protein
MFYVDEATLTVYRSHEHSLTYRLPQLVGSMFAVSRAPVMFGVSTTPLWSCARLYRMLL